MAFKCVILLIIFPITIINTVKNDYSSIDK